MAIPFKSIRLRVFSGAVLIAVLAALTVIVAFGPIPAGAQDMKVRLEASLARSMAASKVPGAIVGVWKGDFAWTTAKGLANLSKGTPMRTSYVWRVGSVTKTFVATAVLRLCDKGLLSLDNRLSRFRPDFPKADVITVRQLLQHNAGIFSWDEDEATRTAIIQHSDRGWTMEKMIRLAAGKPFYFEPGTGHHYSNVGYFLLGPIIKQASGKSVARVIQEEIADPLGLRHTYLPDGPRYKDEVIHGYMTKGGALKDTYGLRFADLVNYDLAHTPGGLVSTLADLKVWVQALASGRLLSARLHKEQLRPAPFSEKNGSSYGLGVVMYRDWLGHSGGVAGSMCNVYTNPKAATTIIHYFNKLDPLDEKQNAVDLKALREVLLEMMRIAAPASLPKASREPATAKHPKKK